MGRNYYCDYCEKTMKIDANVRKNHNEGLPHKILKAKYMQQFRDPKEILKEELEKRPCERFLNGKECKFGFLCHFSHYTPLQLNQLRYLIDNPHKRRHLKEHRKLLSSTTNSKNRKHNDKQNIWNYPYQEKYIPLHNVPLSLRPINFDKIPFKLKSWGE